MDFCLYALSPSFFGTLKAPSSDQYHFYQDGKPLVSWNAPNTHTSAPALSRPPFLLSYLQISLFSEPSRMPLSQKVSRQTNVLCPCNTPSTVSSLLMMHMVYSLTLRIASLLFLVYWGFFISIYVWAAGCALDTAELKRDGAVKMANYICLHGISRVSRSAISSMSAPPPGQQAGFTSALVMVSKWESQEKVNIQVGSATTNECTSSYAGRKKISFSATSFGPRKRT